MRLAVAAVVALALTAGCAGLGATDGGTTAPTATATATGTATQCSTDLLLTDDGAGELTPRPLPDRSADLTAETAGRFAGEYERAFAHNHALADGVRDVTVELQGTTVRAVDGGYRVRIHVWTRTTVEPSADATVSEGGDGRDATVEEAFYDAHYYVSEGALRRAETERHGTLPDGDLSSSGVTLACWAE